MPILVSGIDYNTGGGIKYIEVRDKHNFDSVGTECCFCMNHLILWSAFQTSDCVSSKEWYQRSTTFTY